MTDILTLNFKKRLRALLPGNEELQRKTRSQLWQILDFDTRSALGLAAPTFFQLPPTGKTVICLHYPCEAIICRTRHWEALDNLCKQIYELVGIEEVYIRGIDLCCRCQFNPTTNQWIREEVI